MFLRGGNGLVGYPFPFPFGFGEYGKYDAGVPGVPGVPATGNGVDTPTPALVPICGVRGVHIGPSPDVGLLGVPGNVDGPNEAEGSATPEFIAGVAGTDGGSIFVKYGLDATPVPGVRYPFPIVGVGV
jgi:hypothetical protein